MDPKSLSVDWAVVIPAIAATAGPTVVGFLQEWSKNVIEKAPWYAKSILTTIISGLIGAITAYMASGDALLSGSTGAILGAIGSMNIALRKGTRGNLEVTVAQKPTPPAP